MLTQTNCEKLASESDLRLLYQNLSATLNDLVEMLNLLPQLDELSHYIEENPDEYIKYFKSIFELLGITSI